MAVSLALVDYLLAAIKMHGYHELLYEDRFELIGATVKLE